MRCFLCKMPLVIANHGICSQCVAMIPRILKPCPQCGLPHSLSSQRCYRCRENQPYWDKLIAVSDYSLPLKKMIHHFKFYQKIELTRALARLMFLSWYQNRVQNRLIKPDIVTCVPLHRIRYWSRGFNQSELLAKPIARWLDCDFKPHLLQRKKRAADQKNLSLDKRKENVQALFQCQTHLNNKTIMLVDDIVTTGSTINAISQLLKRQGAADVQIICLCRTIL